MAGLKEKVTGTVDDVREQRPIVEHIIQLIKHYGSVNGTRQAGAVTYFGFLSFFPLLALAFFAVGIITRVYSGAEQELINGIDSVFPNVVGKKEGELSLDQLETFSGLAGLIGLAGVLFAGLNWLSAMRDSLEVMFEMPQSVQPNFVVGKLRDLASLVSIGTILLTAAAVTGVLTGFSDLILELVGLGDELGWLVILLSTAMGFLANVLLFYVLFRLLAKPPTPTRSLIKGAVVGAILFEILKRVAVLLVALTKGNPAFQAFGIALIVLVLIYYFHRVVMYSAAWAHTTREARAMRSDEGDPVQGPQSPSLRHLARIAADDERAQKQWVTPFASGAAAMLGLMALVKRRRTK